jgi:hypothetical protein
VNLTYRRPAIAVLALAVSGFGLAAPLAAATAVAADRTETAPEAEVEKTPTAKETLSWRLEPGLKFTARGISASSTAQAEDDVIDSNALALIVTPSLVLTNKDVAVTLRNSVTRLEFEDSGRTDLWQNAARVAARFNLSEATSVTGFGERADNMLTAEFTSTDEWEFGGEIEHSFDVANRVQLGASWRTRRYDDADSSTGKGLRVDGEYRYRFGPNHYGFLRSRYDEIGSGNARRDLDRWLLEASYQRPIAKDLSVRSEFSYQRLNFSGRALDSGGVRQDDVFWPELTLIWSPGPWRLAAEGRYIVRNSTDPQFDRSGFRFELEISHVF